MVNFKASAEKYQLNAWQTNDDSAIINMATKIPEIPDILNFKHPRCRLKDLITFDLKMHYFV